MSNLLEKASILLTPTGSDNGSINCIKPSSPTSIPLTSLTVIFGQATYNGWNWNGSILSTNPATGGANFASDIFLEQTRFIITFKILSYVSGSLGYRFGGGLVNSNYFNSELIEGNTIKLQVRSDATVNNFQFLTNDFNGSLSDITFTQSPAGDFDFARGTAATRVNSQGLVENVQILGGNLVQNGDFEQTGSEIITNGNFATDSDWSLGTGWSISDGKLRADNVSLINTFQAYVYTSGKIYKVTYTVSDYVKGELRFQLGGGGSTVNGATRNANGTYTEYLVATDNHTSARFRALSADGGLTASIDNVSVKEVGQDWNFVGDTTVVNNGAKFDNTSVFSEIRQDNIITPNSKIRLTITVEDYVSGRIAFPRFGVDDGNGNPNFNINANGTYVFEDIFYSTNLSIKRAINGTNLVISNISVIEITDDTDLPRIDYSPYTGAGTCGHWLLEPQSINVTSNSEQPSTWHSSGGVIITADATTSPEGLQNSSLVVINTSSGNRYARNRLVFSSGSGTQTVTASCFLKYYNNQWVRLRSAFFTGSPANNESSFFDIQNGVLGTVGSNQTAKMEDYGNGWYRCSITFDIDKAQGIAGYMQVELMNADNTNTYAAIGQGFYAFGSQGEELSFMTSYIPTGNANDTTRNQDKVDNSGNSNLISQTEGVLYCEIAALFSGALDNRCITLSDGTGNLNTVEIFYQASANTIKYRIKSDGSVIQHTETVADRSQFNKIALKYKSGDNSMWLNGVKVDTDTSALSFSTTLSELNFAQATGSQKFFGKVKSLAVFKEALTDAELTCLTS